MHSAVWNSKKMLWHGKGKHFQSTAYTFKGPDLNQRMGNALAWHYFCCVPGKKMQHEHKSLHETTVGKYIDINMMKERTNLCFTFFPLSWMHDDAMRWDGSEG